MFDRKLVLENGNYAVRIDGRPGAGVADIDMYGDANTEWNSRNAHSYGSGWPYQVAW